MCFFFFFKFADTNLFNFKRNVMKKLLCLLSCCLLLSVAAFAQQHRVFEKGYAGNVSVGGMWSRGIVAEATTSHGYSFGNGLYMGLGAGIHSEIEFSPLFADIRYAFGKEVNRPFVGVKLGMAFFNPEYLFVNPSFGVDFGRVSASLSYVQWNADLKATNGITGHVKFHYFLAGVSFWF